MRPAVRLGEINFINALPLKLPESQVVELGLERVCLAPTGLNQGIHASRLDVSPVSSAFYLRHQDELVLLPELSISAENPVESVLLFLPGGLEGLMAHTTIAVPDSSATSIALMQYLLYQYTGHRYRDNLVPFAPGEGLSLLLGGSPLLAIGDEALYLKDQVDKGTSLVIDLAEAWLTMMQMPFVFAVWVARKDWAEANPERLQQINFALINQKKAFQASPEIQQHVFNSAKSQRPGLPMSLLVRYFTTALSYNLEKGHMEALAQFAAILNWIDDDGKFDLPRHRTQLPIQLLHR